MKLDRRSFLKGAALTSAAAVFGGASMACSPTSSKDAATATTKTEEGGPALTADTAAAQKWSFEIVPDPIPESEIAETITADIVVVGGGMSGLCTACRATELGADVVVVSASSMPISRGGSNNGIGTAVQKSFGIDYTPQDAAHQIKVEQILAGYNINTELWGQWIQNSAESVDWMCGIMEKKGLHVALEFGANDPDGFFTSPASSHSFWNEEQPFGAMFGAPMQAAAYAETIIENGGTIYYSTVAQQLIREDDNTGRVSAVIALREDGTYAKYAANKAVVLATGDFSKDRDLMARYAPDSYEAFKNIIEWDKIDYDAGFTFTGLYPGQGHKMALWVGASWQRTFPNAAMSNTLSGIIDIAGPLLNTGGRRFINENIGGHFASFMARILPHLKEKTAYFIWDANYADTKEVWNNFGTVIDYVNGIQPATPDEMRTTWEQSAADGAFFKGDTLQELLAQLDGLDAETALETLDRWNGYCENGYDEEFQVNPELMHPVKTGPFYGIPITQNDHMFLTVLGGLRTDESLQVCDTNDEPIEGLYCVGTMIGDFYSNLYSFDVFGQNLGACCCTLPYLLAGRLAQG